jgi:hypothetical protein
MDSLSSGVVRSYVSVAFNPPHGTCVFATGCLLSKIVVSQFENGNICGPRIQ